MKYRIISLILAFSLFVSLCGCTPKTEADPNTLTLYVTEEQTFWNVPIDRFKTENEGVTVDVVSFKTDAELETQLANDLTTGGGPDVVLWSSDSRNSGIDMRKLAMNGNFLALDEYFAADETFDAANYYQSVLDCGKIGGVQYIVPAAFNVPLVMCRQSTYEAAGIGEMDSISMADFCRIIAEEADALAGKDGQYALAISNFTGPIFFAYSGLMDFDYAAKTVTVDREAFREFIDAYAALRDEINRAMPIYENIRNVQELVKYCSYVYATESLTGSMCWTLTAAEPYGELPAYFHFGTYDGKGSVALSTIELAVNKNTKNPDLAYRFIRSVMDGPAIQMMEYEYEITATSSVSRGASAMYYGVTIPEHFGTNYPKYMYPQIMDSLEATTECAYVSQALSTIMFDAVTPYLNGEEDFEPCFERMMNKLTLYITE